MSRTFQLSEQSDSSMDEESDSIMEESSPCPPAFKLNLGTSKPSTSSTLAIAKSSLAATKTQGAFKFGTTTSFTFNPIEEHSGKRLKLGSYDERSELSLTQAKTFSTPAIDIKPTFALNAAKLPLKVDSIDAYFSDSSSLDSRSNSSSESYLAEKPFNPGLKLPPTQASKDPFDFDKVRKEMTEIVKTPEMDEEQLKAYQLGLLKSSTDRQDSHEVTGTPIFTKSVLEHFPKKISQYGFLAGMCDVLDRAEIASSTSLEDPRVYFNISAPSSAFICGSQGSGKSHTLSCLLENCLMASGVSKLEHPLSALVFHYDSFTSDASCTPCEAAWLANPEIKVRVLCSPTNLQTMKRIYKPRGAEVEALRIDQKNLDTKRMWDLMAVNQDNSSMPLYLHAINRILRSLRMEQQQEGQNKPFDYAQFKKKVAQCDMTPAQLAPLNQRLDTLESFMPAWQTETKNPAPSKKNETAARVGGTDWSVKPGTLTIVDLSCPCVTAEGACALFNMCLSLFLEQPSEVDKIKVGRVVALDEAHKYMNDTSEANSLTNTLLSSIRLQRHLGTRVFISTQEPTISPKLLDLCSTTIVHRFTSPQWLQCLKKHLAALDHEVEEIGEKVNVKTVFNKIVQLRVGEALLFAPSAIVGIEKEDGDGAVNDKPRIKKLGVGVLRIKIRSRITEDGGKDNVAD